MKIAITIGVLLAFSVPYLSYAQAPTMHVNGKEVMLKPGMHSMGDYLEQYDLEPIRTGMVSATLPILKDVESNDENKKELALKFIGEHVEWFSKAQKDALLKIVLKQYQKDKRLPENVFSTPLILKYNNIWSKYDILPEEVLKAFRDDLHSDNQSIKCRAAAVLIRFEYNEQIKNAIFEIWDHDSSGLPNLWRMFKGSPQAITYLLPTFIELLKSTPAPQMTGNLFTNLLNIKSGAQLLGARRKLLMTLRILTVNDVARLVPMDKNTTPELKEQLATVYYATTYGNVPTNEEYKEIQKIFLPIVPYIKTDLAYSDPKFRAWAALILSDISPDIAEIKKNLEECTLLSDNVLKTNCQLQLERKYTDK